MLHLKVEKAYSTTAGRPPNPSWHRNARRQRQADKALAYFAKANHRLQAHHGTAAVAMPCSAAQQKEMTTLVKNIAAQQKQLKKMTDKIEQMQGS